MLSAAVTLYVAGARIASVTDNKIAVGRSGGANSGGVSGGAAVTALDAIVLDSGTAGRRGVPAVGAEDVSEVS